jgi:hypothetical protein
VSGSGWTSVVPDTRDPTPETFLTRFVDNARA